jgi:hypothetical protein
VDYVKRVLWIGFKVKWTRDMMTLEKEVEAIDVLVREGIVAYVGRCKEELAIRSN